MIPNYVLQKIGNSEKVLGVSESLRVGRYVSLTDVVELSKDRRVVVWDSQETEGMRVTVAKGAMAEAVGHRVSLCLDYFKNMLSRDGITGKGHTVNVNINFGKNYPNAFWDGKELVLGNGDGRFFKSFALSLDVIAHEMAHGVVQHTANLIYQDQAGALNEHFADVLGTACQMSILNKLEDDYDWLIGNEIMVEEGEALRSMRSPGLAYDHPIMGKDEQPSHMNRLYVGREDNGGVHINSGIMNRMFFLTAKEMGIHSAVRIWYGALTKLGNNAKFSDAVREFVKVTQMTGIQGSTQIVRWAAREVGVI